MTTESYTVESTLRVRSSELTEALAKVAALAREAGEAVRRLNGAGQSLTSLSSTVTRLNETLGRTALATAKVGDAMARSGDISVRNLTGASVAAERLERAINGVARASRSMGSITPPTMPVWRPGPGGGLPPRAANGNSTSIAIPAVPGGADSSYSVHDSSPPPPPPKSPRGAGGGHGDDGTNQLIVGGLIAGAGAAILKGVGDLAAAGGTLGAAQAALRMQLANDPNKSQDYSTATTAAAGLIKKYPMIKLSDAISLISDVYSVTGTMPEAAALAPTVAGYQAVAASIPGHKANSLALMQAAEASGYTVDPQTHKYSQARVETFIGLALKLVEATRGSVDESSLQNFFRQAGPSGRNLSVAAIMQLAPVLKEMGAQKAGTALTSAYQELIGGTMTEKVADALEQIGMLDKRHVKKTRTGVRIDPGSVTGAALFATNPVDFVNTVLMPQIEKMHPNWGPTQVNQELTQLFGRQTVQRLMADLISQSGQYAKDFAQEKQAATAPQALAVLNASYAQGVTNLSTALASLAQVVGSDVTPTLIPAMKGLTASISDLTAAATAHPGAAKAIAGLAVGLGSLMIVGGGLAATIGALKFATSGFRSAGGLFGLGGAAGAGEATSIGGEVGAGIAARLLASAGPVGLAIGAGILATIGAEIGLGKLASMFPASDKGRPLLPGQAPGDGKQISSVKVALPQLQPAPHPDARRGSDGRIMRGGYESDPITVNVTTNLTADGRKLASVVTAHQVAAARRPSASSSRFDDSQNIPLPSHSVASR